MQIKTQFGLPALDVDPRPQNLGPKYMGLSYKTGTSGVFQDTPNDDLQDYYGLQQIYNSREDTFNDYLMYVPDGANSRPVALRETTFSWHGVATRILGAWVLDKQLSARVPKADQIGSVPASTQPMWFENNLSKDWEFIPEVLPPG